jgi:hypothetical protein
MRVDVHLEYLNIYYVCVMCVNQAKCLAALHPLLHNVHLLQQL